ncbi:MAG: ribonuclease III [Ignavibacteriaceae bacterium]|nr:ribonuclease III [Ignavibacteriaceae bacterium]
MITLLSKYFDKRKSIKLLTKKNLKLLEQLINSKVAHPKIFVEAFTHRSAVDHVMFKESNERLEFLGDALLGFIIGEALFNAFPAEDEGFLTKIRSNFVNKAALYDCAKRINLLQFIFVGAELNSGTRNGFKTILADGVEALIGAIYIDCGMEKTKQFIRQYIVEPNLKLGMHLVDENFKSQLLEYSQAARIENPKYIVIGESGPEHDREFTVQIKIGEKIWGEGKGKSKKSAEQEAAKIALQTIPAEDQKYLHKPDTNQSPK